MFFVMKRIQAKSLGIEHDGDDMRKRMRVYVCVCVCVYNWTTLLYSRKWHVVNQLYFNYKKRKKE